MRRTSGEPSIGAPTPTEHEFTLVIRGPLDDESVLDELFEAGCSDGTFGTVDGLGFADFHREAPTLSEALDSAIRDVESVDRLQVLRVEPDDLVTMAEIAERLERSRESIRLLVAGQRGDGDFPPPVSHSRSRSRLWRWSEVSAWARHTDDVRTRHARLIAAVNAALELRQARANLGVDAHELIERLAL